MKQESGWITAAVVAIATTVGVSSFQARPVADAGAALQANEGVRASAMKAGEAFAEGPCAEIESRLQTFFMVPSEKITAPRSCYGGAPPPPAHELQEKSAALRFIIATLPDPLHTHFSLIFDRAAEAIQQAAQDDRYVYDSSWLPWETESTPYVRLDDQDQAKKRKEAMEDQPGILLFRSQLGSNSPYPKGLVVFIVGEEPTGGIHRAQFQNATAWINILRPHVSPARSAAAPPAAASTQPETPTQILGPSFSGSLPSLVELLQQPAVAETLQPTSGKPLQIYSGNVTSKAAVDWLTKKSALATKDREPARIQFLSFQQNDDRAMQRYCDYLGDTGALLERLAVISEDETAYGADYNAGDPRATPCSPPEGQHGPTYLYYPRDISALRAAYQSQSVFSRALPQSASDAARRTLRTDLADPGGEQHDSIRNYSGDQTALSQEAELQQIVSLLRLHRSEYILLRSSNPLDQIFLSHFFRLAYPEGRIVILGADLLLRRETGSAGLNGIMLLSTYPLLPWGQDWTKPVHDPMNFHSHRVFTHDGAEGMYIAARFLLHAPLTAADPFLPPNCDTIKNLRDYSVPLWMYARRDGCTQPPTYLSVLGNGGFWPVAAIPYTKQYPQDPEVSPKTVAEAGAQLGPSWSGVTKPYLPPAGYDLAHPERYGTTVASSDANALLASQEKVWLGMPLSMKLCLLALLVVAIFHAICCSLPSVTVRPGHRAHFVRLNSTAHPALILFGSFVLAVIPMTLAWGLGEMSSPGAPLPNPLPYRLLLPSIWLIAGFAVTANVWVEHRLRDIPAALPGPAIVKLETSPHSRPVDAWLRIWWPPIAYVVASALFYLFLDLMLEKSLTPFNRIPTYLRSIHLTTGVSPLTPLITLTIGLYGWFWYALEGMALFGKDRPRLPVSSGLKITQPDGTVLDVLGMLSCEGMGARTEQVCSPSAPRVLAVGLLSFVSIIVVALLVGGEMPLRSLGSSRFAIVFSLWLTFCTSILLANAWQLHAIWSRLRQLLLFLDKLPLRRTLEALKGFSWGSVWKMSGNVLDVRYKLIFRQLENLNHLRTSLAEWGAAGKSPGDSANARRWVKTIEDTLRARQDFAVWYSDNWSQWKARDLARLKHVQDHLATTAAVVLTQILVPAWHDEGHSLVLDFNQGGDSPKSVPGDHPVARLPLHLQNAEEMVSLVFLGFIQNILGRMRSLATGIICLFISIAISVASYPFDPRPLLSGAIVALFILLGVIIIVVYSQMHRDATLSHLTNTQPGELGSEFWLKLVGFGIGPVLGLLASVFPEFSSFFFSWLQPGLNSVK